MRSASIVIPVYNGAATVGACIEACLGQVCGCPVDVIVVDDGSGDATAEVVSRYPVRFLRQANRGPAAARNRGWRAASGDAVCFTDADCVPPPDWVARHLAQYVSPRIGAAGGSYDILNSGSLLAQCIHDEIRYRHARMRREARALGSYNLSVRRQVLEEIGGFDESYPMASAEDNDLSYKIIRKGHLLVFDAAIRVAHHHPEKLSRYLRTQFWHGFWRVKLYRDHPGMTTGDDYSGILDYAQPVIALAVLALLPFSWIGAVAPLTAALVAAEAMLQLPVAVPVMVRTKRLSACALPFITFARAFARGCGMACGAVRSIAARSGA